MEVIYYAKTQETFTGIAEWPDGSKCWYKDGRRHREDGPAIEHSNGDKEWWLEGQEYGLLNIKDYVVLDHYKGEYDLVWYRLLGKNHIFEYPNIPGLIKS